MGCHTALQTVWNLQVTAPRRWGVHRGFARAITLGCRCPHFTMTVLRTVHPMLAYIT